MRHRTVLITRPTGGDIWRDLLAGSLMLWASLAPAQEDNESFMLDPVVVTATREPLGLLDLPNSVSVLDQGELTRRLVRTLPEALVETPGVLAQKTSHGQGSPFIRGFTGFHNLALIDGIRLNNSVFRNGPNQYSAGRRNRNFAGVSQGSWRRRIGRCHRPIHWQSTTSNVRLERWRRTRRGRRTMRLR